MNLTQILMNENPLLINIFTTLFSIPEAYLFCKLFTLLLNIDTNKKSCIKYVLTMSICGGILAFLSNSLVKDIFVLLTFALSMKIIFNQSIKNIFIAIILSYFVSLVSEYISIYMLIFFTHIKYEEIILKPMYYLVVLASTLLFMYFIIVAIRQIKKCKMRHKEIVPINASIIINLILGILTMFIETYILSVYMDIIPLWLIIIMIIITAIYFFISMYSLVRTNTLEKTKENLENEKIYNKTLTLLHDNIRGFKHDFNNIVQAIGGYIALGDMNGLKDYYQRLLDECKLTNNLNLLNPETINNPSIYSLLTNKYYLASEKGIKMTFSIFTDLSKINFNMYEFSRILGILLDNAIEAAEESSEKKIEIEFTSDNKKQLFIIKNSCKDTNISTTKIFEKGYSTKNRNSGFGLWKVHKILSKNTNLDLFTTISGDMFSQQLAVFY